MPGMAGIAAGCCASEVQSYCFFTEYANFFLLYFLTPCFGG